MLRMSQESHQSVIILKRFEDLRNQIMTERSMLFSLSKYNAIMWCARGFISWTSDANESTHAETGMEREGERDCSHTQCFTHTNLKRLKMETKTAGEGGEGGEVRVGENS